jgi:hypothetical protein
VWLFSIPASNTICFPGSVPLIVNDGNPIVSHVFLHIPEHDNPIPAKQKAASISTLLTETAFSKSP